MALDQLSHVVCSRQMTFSAADPPPLVLGDVHTHCSFPRTQTMYTIPNDSTCSYQNIACIHSVCIVLQCCHLGV